MNKTSEYTLTKHDDMRKVLATCFHIAGETHERNARFPYKIIYVDLTAGNIFDPSDPPTFVEAINILEDIHENYRIPYEIHLYEKNREAIGNIRNHLFTIHSYEQPNGCKIELHGTDYCHARELKIPKNCMGVVYADPFGGCDYVSALHILAEKKEFLKIDIIANIGCTGIKRDNGVHKKCIDCQYGHSIYDCMSSIKKKTLKVRKPTGCQQWTIVILSNAPESTFDGRWGKTWYSIEESKEILRQISMTAKEKETINGNGN